MRILIICVWACAFLAGCQGQEPMDRLIDRVMSMAVEQYSNMGLGLIEGQVPRSVDEDGQLITSDIYWWCSGFYPGTLWNLYEYSGHKHIFDLAEKYTVILDPVKYITTDHDVGFQLFCSYGNGFRLTQKEAYKEALIQGAQSLATRFHPTVGCTQSWSFTDSPWKFPVIIDNMLNLELLLWVDKETDNDSLYQMACNHADVTRRNHFRNDFSSYHLVDYNPSNGQVRSKQTVQGADNESSWARGQAWALYGYTLMYRYTTKAEYLNQAIGIADFLINHTRMPEDGIPYWDFDSPDIPETYRDASAGAIIASALIELGHHTSNHTYQSFAEKQVRSLASECYLAQTGTNNHFILKHSVGNLPGNSEIDKPLTYADYYFIEALLRYKKYFL